MDSLKPIVDQYLQLHPSESVRLDELKQFTSSFTLGVDQVRRSNSAGHITASALIVDREWSNLLTIDHVTLHRRLPPGGHIDESDATPLAASLREIEEETGVPANDLQLISIAEDSLVPFDIDSHPIPASAKKNEPAHVHHDFRYLFVYVGDEHFPRPAPEGDSEVAWQSFSLAFTDATGPLVLQKILSLRSMRQSAGL